MMNDFFWERTREWRMRVSKWRPSRRMPADGLRRRSRPLGGLFYGAIVKMFAQHKDDKKRVEKALETCSFPSGKVGLQNFGIGYLFADGICITELKAR
ncbi:hypothetical protein CEXT_531801 [Caerostris extrusa]|uniref:Uncharacterized protein n=1 Tax=Caerostris extrusa TaxID=172846 RepID=A0AAV4MZ19_CAEEX|nr:hypothetical protein CEXT_531801 [Caerostris extrusa]